MADFALPIGHIPVTGGTIVTIPVQLRRPYRQPVVLNDSADFFKGAEIWLEASNSGNPTTDLNDKLFTMFRSLGRYYRGTTPFEEANGQARRLPRFEFKITDNLVINAIQGVVGNSPGRTMMEAPPRNIYYENVDRGSVIIALSALFNSQYTAAAPQSNQSLWHPVMRDRVRPTGNATGQIIKAYIQAQISNGIPQSVVCSNLATSIVDQTLQDPVQLTLNPGDWVGRAAELPFAEILPNFPPPFGYPFFNPRLIRIVMQDIGLFEISPAYYLQKFLFNANFTTVAHRTLSLISYAPLANNTFNHPLLTELNVNYNVNQLPRARINMTLAGEAAPRQVILFPTSKALSTWRGNQNYLATDIGATATSILEWRINNTPDIPFEVRRRMGQDANHSRVRLCAETGNALDVCPTPGTASNNRVLEIWNAYRTPIQDICQILQIPVEAVVTTIGCEAEGVSPRSIAFEPIITSGRGSDTYRRLVANGTIPSVISYQLIGAYNAMTNVERYSRLVPNPYNGSAVAVPAKPGHPSISWSEIRDLIGAYFPARISPGLTQTILETALAELRWLQNFYDNLPQTFGVTPVNTQANVANYQAVFDWLLNARNSILASCARHKRSYKAYSTYYDMVRLGTVYNAGGNVDHPILSAASVYGYRFSNDTYSPKASRYYNAFRNLLRNAANPNNGSPQFWQALP